MSPPLRDAFGDLDQLLRDVVVSAKRQLVLVAPYLSAGGMRGLLNVMAVAAQSGASLKLITSELDGDEGRNRLAIREIFSGEFGATIGPHVRVLTNSPSFHALIHAKVVVADGRRGYLGSANVSWRGMESNLEIGVELNAHQARALDSLFSYLESAGALLEVAAADL
jgi:phosphatidylserine/phosphatidylglycerophosphate/cardiolipin synthase-like enzyme